MAPKKQQRGKRPPKIDRLLMPDITKEQIECNAAFIHYDREAMAMERKWGVDRLPELVAPDVSQKYATTLANLNAALERENPQEVLECVHSALRGLAYLDSEAERNGYTPFEFKIALQGAFPAKDGAEDQHWVVLEDDRCWPALREQMPGVVVYSAREVELALAKLHTAVVDEVKSHFPAARVTDIRTHEKPPVDIAAGGDKLEF